MRTLLVALAFSLVACGGYEPMTVDERREFSHDLIEYGGGYGTKEFWATWAIYWANSAEVLMVPAIDGADGGACIIHDGSVMIVRRPVRSVLLIEDGEACPWDYGTESRVEEE